MASHVSAVLSGDPIGAAIRLGGAMAAGRGSISTQVQESGLMMGGGDTYMLRTAAARVGFGTGLGLLLGSPDAQIDARYVGLNEASGDPSAPAANGAVVYTKDNGAGKTQLCVRFATGAVQVIATQP